MTVTIQTVSGKIAGVRDNDVEIFRGVPFARPPLGELRFRAPLPPEPWEGVRDASEFGGSAPQGTIELDVLPGMDVGPQSEDCLYLNVYTPAADDARRPVLVWIHGGGFVIGSGSQVLYDGAPLARRGDVVVVTINYRMGALGFLHLADLCGEGIGANANAGILDQVAALGWVRDNIAQFGGDPENVTIFGESAGGMSVGTLLGLPTARGLFRRAIPQSGAAHNAASREIATRVAELYLDELGIAPADAKKLRELPCEELQEAQGRVMQRLQEEPIEGATLTFGPVVDGGALTRLPIDAIREGSARGVDMLIGTNRDEWRLFAAMDPEILKLDDTKLLKDVEQRVPSRDSSGTSHASLLIEAYRKAREGKSGTSPQELFCAIETDRVFGIPAVRLADAQAAQGERVYAYLVTWESPLLGGMLGACHAVELPFVFGTLEHAELFSGSGPDAKSLEARMMDAWLAFARNGDPGWEPYDSERRATMFLGRECEVVSAPFAEERRAWEGVID